jgi:hypothetical protein
VVAWPKAMRETSFFFRLSKAAEGPIRDTHGVCVGAEGRPKGRQKFLIVGVKALKFRNILRVRKQNLCQLKVLPSGMPKFSHQRPR